MNAETTTTQDDVFIISTNGIYSIATAITPEGQEETGMYPVDFTDHRQVIYLDAEQLGNPDTLEPKYRKLVRDHVAALEAEQRDYSELLQAIDRTA